NRDERDETGKLIEENETENRRLHRLRTRIGRTHREVAEREQVDEQSLRGNLPDACGCDPAQKDAVRQRKGKTCQEMEPEYEKHRERQAESEAHEGGAGRTHDAFQVLLRRRTQILQEGGGYRDRNPEFHGCGGERKE